MKILHVCNHFYPCTGGIEKYVYDTCKNLQRLGHQSDVVCFDTCAYSKDRLPEKEEHDGIKIFRIPRINLKYYNLSPSVLDFVKDYDILHLHSIGFFTDFLALTKFIHKKPLVLNTHSGIFHTKDITALKNLYFFLWCRFIFGFFDKILADGKIDFDLFSKISNRVELLPVTIDTEVFSKIKRRPQKNLLVYIGRLSKNKRLDLLIKTMKHLAESNKDLKLYIVGKDWNQRSDLEKLVNNLNIKKNVIFVGEVSEEKKLEYLGRCEAFLCASEFEGGAAISVVEAMAAGCPVIVSDIDTHRIFVKNGRNGFLVDYTKPESASLEVEKILNSNLDSVTSAAKSGMNAYDWKDASKKLESVYRGLLSP